MAKIQLLALFFIMIYSASSSLQQGWNAFSIPSSQSFALESINVTYDDTTYNISEAQDAGWLNLTLYYYDQYAQAYNHTHDLTYELSPFRAYWIYSHSDNLTLSFPVDTVMALPVKTPDQYIQEGWNFIGVPHNESFLWNSTSVNNGSTSKTMEEAEAAGWIQGTILYFDPYTQTFNSTPDDDPYAVSSRGYFIFSHLANLTLTFPIDECPAGYYELNSNISDGCEFTVDSSAIYVSSSDANASDAAGCGLGPSGTGNFPCLTIPNGINRAAASARTKVLVALGNYTGSITMSNGVSILGAYDPVTWQRDLTDNSTVIYGSGFGVHKKTITVSGLTLATKIEGFTIYGKNNTVNKGNSYVIWVRNSGLLTIANNIIIAGYGGPGTNGTNGTAGADGVDAEGRDSDPAAYDALNITDTCTERQLGNGGQLMCGAINSSGGNGGGNICPPRQEVIFSGLNGSNGKGYALGFGGFGGSAGLDFNMSVAVCPATSAINGSDGEDGTDAGEALGGECTDTTGIVVNNEWVGTNGSQGITGASGVAGGGGGAGGGVNSTADGYNSTLGAHGGGGGSGGCGGTGGSGGTAGGGSFGIFISTGAGPTVTNNVIYLGRGGNGGNGGYGEDGGIGGLGAIGGLGDTVFCAGSGGKGGNGGKGGIGGGGGGGCGGSAFGIYTSGIGIQGYGLTNTFLTDTAAGGLGGTGGNNADIGSTGAVTSVIYT